MLPNLILMGVVFVSDFRSHKQRQRYFQIFGNWRFMDIGSLQSHKKSGDIHTGSSAILPVHYNNDLSQLYFNDNAYHAHSRKYWVSVNFNRIFLYHSDWRNYRISYNHS